MANPTFVINPQTTILDAVRSNTDLDSRYVNVTGDTMSGALTINTNSTTALLVEQDGVKDNVLVVDTTNGFVAVNSPNAVVGNDFYIGGVFEFSGTSNIGYFQGYSRALGQYINLYWDALSHSFRSGTTYGMFINSSGNVAIGSTNAGATLDIAKSSDQLQLKVKGHSTQTANLTEWQNSSGTPLTFINGSGAVVIDLDTQGLKLGADQDITLLSAGAGDLTITPAADTDIVLTFTGTTNSGVLKWMEDEDYFQFNDDVFINDAENIVLGTTTGSKIGTATTQKLGFWNTTPTTQPTGIVDADGTLADITTKFNSLISKLETMGLLAVV